MCGATGAQQQLESEQAAFYQEATAQSTIAFSQSQQLQAQIKSIYDPILAAGPSQEGFSPGEKEALDAEAVEGTAEAAATFLALPAAARSWKRNCRRHRRRLNHRKRIRFCRRIMRRAKPISPTRRMRKWGSRAS
jgi:hypothetical protein